MSEPALAVLLFCLPSLVQACSCASTGTACSALASTPVALLARVVRDSGEGWGTWPARVVVEEVLHGMPADVKEVEVDTMAGTSCYSRLTLGERYVIYGSRTQGEPVRVQLHSCSFSFNLRGNEVLWEALRQAQAKGPASLVGRVRKRTEKYSTTSASAGLRVVATKGREHLETTTDKDGQFSFLNLTPGPWGLRTDTQGYTDIEAWPRQIDPVPAQGCAVQNLTVSANGTLSGTLRTGDGKPVEGAEVQAFTLNKDGTPDSSPFHTAKTDGQGRYTISQLPAQRYVVGVNAEKYEDASPYPPSFFPGTPNAAEATRIDLPEIGQRDKLDWVLSPPRRAAQLILEFVDERGHPSSEAVANVQDLEGRQRAFVRAGKDGKASVTLWQGEFYSVVGHQFNSAAEDVPGAGGAFRMRITEWEGTSAPFQLDRNETRLRVVLHPKPPRN